MSVLLLWKPHQGGIGIIASAESVVEELGTDPRAGYCQEATSALVGMALLNGWGVVVGVCYCLLLEFFIDVHYWPNGDAERRRMEASNPVTVVEKLWR